MNPAPLLDLRMVQQFLAVAELRSFRKAAERMHMAQPPLSQAIIRLEALLDTKLFLRTPQGVLMTPAGEMFEIEARRLMHQAATAVQRTRSTAAGESGTVRLAFISPAVFALLGRLLTSFRQQFPAVTLQFTEGSSLEVARLINRDAVDMGFLVTPAALERDVATEVIFRDSLVAVLPVAHALASRPSIALEELADDAFVLLSATGVPTLSGQAIHLCRAAGFEPRVTQEAVQIATVVGLVAAGLGVSLLPQSVSSLATKGVVFVEIEEAGALAQVALSVAFRRENLSSATHTLLEAVQEAAASSDATYAWRPWTGHPAPRGVNPETAA